MKYLSPNTKPTPCVFYHTCNEGVMPCKELESALALHRAIREQNKYLFSKVLYCDKYGKIYTITD